MTQTTTQSTLLRYERALLDGIGISCFTIVLLSIIYFFYQLNAWITIPISTLALSYWIRRIRTYRRSNTTTSLDLDPKKANGSVSLVAAYISIAINMIVLGLLLGSRTNLAIVSPWQILPNFIFGLYFSSTVALVVSYLSPTVTHTPIQRLATMFHFCGTWGVAAIVYRLGFGYDPFVHQATERFIDAHGFIDPKQPLYLGQYSAVISLHNLFRIPIDIIDQWLVPVLSVTVIPWVYSLSKKIQSTTSASLIGILAFLLIPFSVTTFTIPHNFSFVCLTLIILLLPIAQRERLHWHLVSIAGAALACHPLLGIPSALIVATHLLNQRWKFAWALPFIGSIILLPVSFAVYQYQQTGVAFVPLLLNLQDAIPLLFHSPYLLSLDTPLSTLYWFMHLWPLLFCIIGCIGYWKQDRLRSPIPRILLSTAAGLILAALWLASYIRLANILPSEQFEFALRLIVITPIFFVPGVAFLFEQIQIRTNKPSLLFFTILSCVTAGIATSCWYMTYPQYNAIAQMNAPGMSQDDIDAVQHIETMAHGKTYAVLSHQLMSAAALRTFGFERTLETNLGKRYPYAIPTGGELYHEFLSVWNATDLQSWKQEVFQLIHVEEVYLAIPISWDPSNELHQRIAGIATSSTHIGNSIRIYQFER